MLMLLTAMWEIEKKFCLWKLLRVVHEQWKRLNANGQHAVLAGATPCVKHDCETEDAHELHKKYLDIEVCMKQFKSIRVERFQASPGVDIAKL